jgi:transcriptional regulator with XRE-family HTH domain
MFDIGASLREARTRRGLSLDDVTTGLRIRERYVTALEEERWELMPGEAYAKGFLRMYAEFLGLDGSLYVDEYNERVAAHLDQALVLESLAPSRGRSRLLTRTIVGVVAVAAVVAALNVFGSGSPTSTHVQPDLSNVANAAPAKRVVTPRAPVAAPVVRHVAPSKPLVALIRAVTSRSWLSVRVGGANGKEIFRGFLNQGHKLTYGLNQNVWLRIGRPNALTIRIGKNVVGGLPGSTPANLLLTRDGPRAG